MKSNINTEQYEKSTKEEAGQLINIFKESILPKKYALKFLGSRSWNLGYSLDLRLTFGAPLKINIKEGISALIPFASSYFCKFGYSVVAVLKSNFTVRKSIGRTC